MVMSIQKGAATQTSSHYTLSEKKAINGIPSRELRHLLIGWAQGLGFTVQG